MGNGHFKSLSGEIKSMIKIILTVTFLNAPNQVGPLSAEGNFFQTGAECGRKVREIESSADWILMKNDMLKNGAYKVEIACKHI